MVAVVFSVIISDSEAEIVVFSGIKMSDSALKIDFHRLLTSCGGLGFLPVAPGTWGSLPPAIIYGLLGYIPVQGVVNTAIIGLMAVLASWICVGLTPDLALRLGKEDPSEVVADEFAGQSLAFLIIGPAVGMAGVWIAVFGFVLFRVFDIFKPLGIRRLEKLPGGWGVLCDDLLAGVYAAVLILIFTTIRAGG